MKEIFYINEMGEASYRRIYKNSGEKKRILAQERSSAKQQHNAYWGSLTEPERQIISYCKKSCQMHASERERKLDAFYRFKNKVINPPQKPEKYAFIFEHFDEFKEWLKSHENI